MFYYDDLYGFPRAEKNGKRMKEPLYFFLQFCHEKYYNITIEEKNRNINNVILIKEL